MATNEATNNNMVGRAKDIANRLTPLQKIALGAVVLTVVAGGMVLSKTGGHPPMSALYTDLSSADASSVVDSLSSRGVDYDLTDAGKTVLVPKDDVYDLRIALAGEGLPSSNEGYALLDNQGITTSEFRQRIDYQRALEGELAKTLTALDDVQSASVHLALPDQSLFIDEPATPTASVLVSGKGVGGGIGGDEVEAIVHLVASSVKDMKPEDVTVIDANGTVLSTAGDGISGASSGARAKAVSEYENRVSSSIMALLTRMTGPNKVAVTVNAQLDLDESQSTSENYEPIGTNPSEGQVLTEKTSTEQYGTDPADNSDTGILGPDGAVISDNITDTTDEGTDYVKDDQERTYALDRIVEQTTNVPGEVKQLNVAVLMDESSITAEQATAVQEMVSTAAGLDPARGDSIVVTRMPFDTSASTQADELAAADEKAAAKEQMMGMVRTVAVLLVILIALFLGYRSAKNARKVTATPINIGEIGSGPRNPLLGGAAMPLGAGNAALGSADATMLIDQPVSAVGARVPDRDAVVMNELTFMADRRPEEVANVLKAWLAESKVRR